MKKVFIFLLLGIAWFIPNLVFAEEIASPDFLVRISLASYDDRDYAELPKFNYRPGTPTDYYVKGEKRQTDLPMLLEDGRTMLPLRLVGEACAAEVSWDNAQKQAVVQLGGQKAVVRLGSQDLLLDGQTVAMGAAPTVRGGVVYLPLRAIGEALGKEVFYCSRLQQAFIMVYDKELANYENRQNFNQLMEQTYLNDYGDIWDIGRQKVVTVKNNEIYTDGSGLFEQAFVGDCWLACTPRLEEELGCKLLSLTMPQGNGYYIIGLYNNGETLEDVRILWDGPAYYEFSDDGFVYDHYWYATESWTEKSADGSKYTDCCRFFRIDLHTPPDKYFTPEYLGVKNYHYGFADYNYENADGMPRYIVTKDAIYAHGYRDPATSGDYPEGWFKIFLDGSGHDKVSAPPPADEWLYQVF